MLKQTPLFKQHQALGAKMVPFAGWEMPLHYGSQVQEHQQVRQGAGVFDVSHMTVVDLTGSDVRNYLRYLLANDVDKLAQLGKALYSCMLNTKGGIIDDLIVYFIHGQHYRLILNAATREKDLAWMEKQAEGFTVDFQERHDLAMVAVQGPQAIEKTLPLLPATQKKTAATLQRFECALADDWFIAYTGYTGEPGFEIVLPAAEVVTFWDNLLSVGVKPIGLGARDSLRLEAGCCLYGIDMDETTTPLEAALGWTVAWEPDNRIFLGHDVLREQRHKGPQQILVGLQLEDKGILRKGQMVRCGDGATGIITSGSFSPILQHSIAFARLPVNAVEPLHVIIRDKAVPASRVRPPFYKKNN
ncbi:MAG: glycine cleavage system aminomethyltransferase GcvT [Gammaproteobacteria bacterium]